MPLVVWAKQKDKIDGSMKGKVYSFIEKLQKDDTAAGLHIEPMHSPVDARVRTGRIDLNYRAVLFKVRFDQIPYYFYYGAWPHDEAIEVARSSQLQINHINGVLEVIRTTPPPAKDHDGSNVPPVEEPTSGGPSEETIPVPVPEAPEHTAWQNPLVEFGFTADHLVGSLGLERELVERARAAGSEDILFDVLTAAPEWQASALLELAAGTSVDEIQEKLSLERYVDDPQKSDEEKLKEALERPATRMQFTFIGDNPDELKQVIEGSDFDAWRTFLHPEQRLYTERRYKGSFRLSGGAGTGKTVVLLHRARMLANAEPQSRIVLTTYTTTLADSLASGLAKLDADVPRADRLGKQGLFVAGVDSLVSKVLHEASELEQRHAMKEVFGLEGAIPGKILDTSVARHQWESVLNDVAHQLELELANATFLQQEYETVVLPNFISSKDEYLTIPRTGRGTALNRSKRLGVWKIIESYRYYNRIEMHSSFVELAHIASVVLRQRAATGGGRVADHVLIDESQDLGICQGV